MAAAVLTGSWRGELDVNGARLPLVFNFSGEECTLDSPAQGAKGIPARVSYMSADSVALSIPAIGAAFSGRVAHEEISGMFAQGAYALPLQLHPEAPVDERRPQTPRPPFPYTATDTTFCSADGTLLAGTLTLPRGGAHVAVVMVTGSGPQNRDEELFDHKPFAVIADYLARNGIASLRYDDRGVGASAGNFAASGINEFRADASAALAFMRSLGVARSVGVLGHSEGGSIAMLMAADGEPDFIISLAGMAVSGKETVMAQNRHSLVSAGLPEAQVNALLALLDHGFDRIVDGSGFTPADARAYAEANGLDVPPALMQTLEQQLAAVGSENFRQILALHPAEKLAAVECPVLALNGTLDTQVDATANLAAIAAGAPIAKTIAFPGLNHLFQHAESGEVSEYERITETISPDVLRAIVNFLQKIDGR